MSDEGDRKIIVGEFEGRVPRLIYNFIFVLVQFVTILNRTAGKVVLFTRSTIARRGKK